MVIRGEEPFPWPDVRWIKAPEGFDSKEVVVNAFRTSSGKIIETIKAFSDADLEGIVETEWGPQSRFDRCRFMTLHIWYHGGQVNYIQTMLGDDAWHWN
jgi:hypothetical protein